MRDPLNQSKIDPLNKAFGELFDKLEIVAADLLEPESIHRAVEGCNYVIHTASPLPVRPPKDENMLIKPAVEGTLTVL